MPGLDGERSEQTRPRKHPPARPRDVRVKDELSEAAIRAMEEGARTTPPAAPSPWPRSGASSGSGPCGAPTSRT